MTILVASALFGLVVAQPDDYTGNGMNSLEKWRFLVEEISNLPESSEILANDDPGEFSYMDGPYPAFDDDGSSPGGSPLAGCFPWGDCYVSDVFFPLDSRVPPPYTITAMGGDFLVGEVHEAYVGDQNDNGILEWVVYFIYFPWFEDDIDNDGDGCVDERIIVSGWDPPPSCDAVPDAAVIYETGGRPVLGGDNADLFANIDYYSRDTIEIFRAFSSRPWYAYKMRSLILYPQIAGEFISYYSYEGINDVNANPERDNDRRDWYVGNIDARRFPISPPMNHICSAGYQLSKGSTFPRDDGWVVTSFELREYYDNYDWNGDGDAQDSVSAYYAVDPVTGDCRLNVVNTGVQGIQMRNTGVIITPYYTSESRDGRDWNGNGISYDTSQLYHDINSTWNMKGKAYVSYTFTSLVPTWGFGWWGLWNNGLTNNVHPLSFGGTFYKYLGASGGYYNAFFFLTSDEDGNRHTQLPEYRITYGFPAGTLAGRCVVIYAYESYLRYANVRLIGGFADGNGDGDETDPLGLIYCPDNACGGGEFVVEATSKFAKGLYTDPIPYIWLGYVLYPGTLEFGGYASVVFYRSEYELGDDCDGDFEIGGYPYPVCYAFYTVAVPPLEDGGKGQMPKRVPGSETAPQNNIEFLLTRTMEGLERV